MEDQGRPQEARKKLRKALEIDPDFELVYQKLGWDYFRQKQYENAIEYFEKAVSLDPGSVGHLNGLAQSYRLLKDYEAAADYFQEAIDANPEVAWLHINYASMLVHQLQDTVKAYEVFEQAKRITSDPIQLNFALINILIAEGEMDSVYTLFDEILELDSRNSLALAALCNIYYYDSLYHQAIESGQRCMEFADTIKGDGPFNLYQVYNNMAMSYYQIGEFEKSIQYAHKARMKNPTSPWPYTTLAEAHWLWKKYELFYENIKIAFGNGNTDR